MKNVPSVIDGIEFKINGEIRTTSFEVAKYFEKRHFDVMRAIKDIECSEDFRQRNFALSELKDSRGKTRDAFFMNKKGFTFLALGFTGGKAAKFRESYIDAFDKMESFIKEELSRRAEDDRARFGCRPMTDALKNTRLDIGKDTKPYHFSNEHNMIYRIVLGATRKKWCESHDIDMKERFRDHMPEPMITAIADMQKINTAFIDMGWDYQKRKEELNKLYTKRHLNRCLDAIVKLEE